MKELTFQRNQLYQEVWSTPMSHLVNKYEISHHQLKKVCKNLQIPTPPTGYWAKIRHGKEVPVPSLPESEISSFTLNVYPKSLRSKPPKTEQTIKVPKRLVKPHLLIKKTRENLQNRHINHFNRVNAGPLDVSVAPANIDRAMRILNTLLKEMNKRGYQIHSYLQNSSYKTYINYGKDKIYFFMREQGARRERKKSDAEPSWWSRTYDYIPTGQLKLSISDSEWHHHTRTISDTQTLNLEGRLDEFFQKLQIMGEEAKRSRLDREEWRRQREHERRFNELLQRQEQEELKHRELLEEQSEQFIKSKHLFEYIDAMEKQRSQLKLDDEATERIDKWLSWAREHANRLNPIKKTVNSIVHTGVAAESLKNISRLV